MSRLSSGSTRGSAFSQWSQVSAGPNQWLLAKA